MTASARSGCGDEVHQPGGEATQPLALADDPVVEIEDDRVVGLGSQSGDPFCQVGVAAGVIRAGVAIPVQDVPDGDVIPFERAGQSRGFTAVGRAPT